MANSTPFLPAFLSAKYNASVFAFGSRVLRCLLLLLSILPVTLHAQYSGTGQLSLSVPAGASNVQWFSLSGGSAVAISGATQSAFSPSGAGAYFATFSNAATSCGADQTVVFVLLNQGETLSLQGSANNSGAGAYQWLRDGAPVSGGNTADISISEGGLYTLQINQGLCNVSSDGYYVYYLLDEAAGTADCSKTLLYQMPVAGTPGQHTLVVTVDVSTAGCFSPVSVSGSGLSLAAGLSNWCTLQSGVQQLHVPLSYNGDPLGQLSFSIGNTGACTADLTIPSKPSVCDVWTLECVPVAAPELR
jgi:hypothetical protein